MKDIEDKVLKQIKKIKYAYYVQHRKDMNNAKKALHQNYMDELKRIELETRSWQDIKDEPVDQNFYDQVRQQILNNNIK